MTKDFNSIDFFFNWEYSFIVDHVRINRGLLNYDGVWLMEGSFIIITGRDPNVKDRRHLWCNVQNSNTNVNCCNRTGTSTITTNDNDHRTESKTTMCLSLSQRPFLLPLPISFFYPVPLIFLPLTYMPFVFLKSEKVKL